MNLVLTIYLISTKIFFDVCVVVRIFQRTQAVKQISNLSQRKSNFLIIAEVRKMANIKSAKKRILVNQTKYERNKAIKSAVKTSIKKVESAVAANDKTAADEALKAATKAITMAGSKGIYHKNNVARKVSRLTKLVNTIA